MKKAHLYAASALLSVFLLTGALGTAQAETTAPMKEAVQMKDMRGPMHDGKGRHAPKMSEEEMMKCKEMRESFMADHKEAMTKERELRKELHEILVAPSFDKTAYLAKHAEMQKAHEDMARARAVKLAEKAETLSAEERAKLPGMMMGRCGDKMKGKMMGHKGGKGMMKDEAKMDMPKLEMSKTSK